MAESGQNCIGGSECSIGEGGWWQPSTLALPCTALRTVNQGCWCTFLALSIWVASGKTLLMSGRKSRRRLQGSQPPQWTTSRSPDFSLGNKLLWQEFLSKRNSFHWRECKITATRKNSCTVSYKTKHIPYNPAIRILAIYPRAMKTMFIQKAVSEKS